VAAAAIASKILNHQPAASILMLEAGGRVKLRDFALFQNYLLTNKLPADSRSIYDSFADLPYADRDKPGENVSLGTTLIPLNGARLMVLGGSTVHWGGWSFRLKPEDFKLSTNTGKGVDWAIDYQTLEPYYCEAEHYIGVSGDSGDTVTPRTRDYPFREFPFTLEDSLHIESFKKLGFGYSHLPIARHGFSNTISSHAPCQTTGTCKYCPFGARFAAANHLDDLRMYGGYPNFTIQHNTVVEEISMDSKSRARAVRIFNKENSTRETVEAETIIIASGAIESPKLLLRSVSEFWKNGIGNDNDLVGRNFITHPYFSYKAVLPENDLNLRPEMGFPTLVSRHFDSEAEQGAGKFILVNPPSSPFVESSDNVMKPDVSLFMKAGKTREEIAGLLAGRVNVQIQGLIEVFSEHKNRVVNSDKRNRFGMLETVVNFTEDEEFKERINQVKATADKIFEQMGAADTVEERPLSWRADHAACTARMSKSDQTGVVDRNLKIHGIENLYVCSNASFASSGAVNPTLTLAALSLRLGDHLVKRM
jgi:choline dehydrogenase-like flavoprotein